MSTRIFLWDLAKKYFTAGLIGLTISDRFASFMAVRGSSMSPTLNPHGGSSTGFVFDDYVLVDKLCLGEYKFARGDIVVFRSPINYKEKNVKRVTALPGDRIYLPSQDTLRVPEGHCWVVGDNTASSMDSRSLGPSFHCRHGKAFLFDKVVNVTAGAQEERMMMTGVHTVVDIFCVGCGSILGWKYVAARDISQKYKVGKYILERFKVLGPDGTDFSLSTQMTGSDTDDV